MHVLNVICIIYLHRGAPVVPHLFTVDVPAERLTPVLRSRQYVSRGIKSGSESDCFAWFWWFFQSV